MDNEFLFRIRYLIFLNEFMETGKAAERGPDGIELEERD
jgi:hypothetical protein